MGYSFEDFVYRFMLMLLDSLLILVSFFVVKGGLFMVVMFLLSCFGCDVLISVEVMIGLCSVYCRVSCVRD